MIQFKEGVAYAGLADVFGGRMWHCIASPTDDTTVWFYTKKECVKHIRMNFTKEDKKHLLAQVESQKGQRAFILN